MPLNVQEWIHHHQELVDHLKMQLYLLQVQLDVYIVEEQMVTICTAV